MKKFFVGCVLVNMMSMTASSIVKADSHVKCVQCSSCQSKEEEKETGMIRSLCNGMCKLIKNTVSFVVKSSVDVVKIATGTYLAGDVLRNGKDSLAGKAYLATKDFTEEKCAEAKKFVTETTESVKNKIIECTKGKEDWEKTYGYLTGNNLGVNFINVAREVTGNGYDWARKFVVKEFFGEFTDNPQIVQENYEEFSEIQEVGRPMTKAITYCNK